MSPEQLQCLLSDRSVPLPELAQSDLFSLGVILYELVSGALPFGLPNMQGELDVVALDLLARQKRGHRPLQEICPDIDGRLASLIEGCLAFEPQHRPNSAKSFADSLRGHQHLYRRVIRWSRHHPFTLICAGISLLLCGLLFGTWLALREPYPIRLYREGQSSLQSGKSSEAVERFNAALQISPDNKEIHIERGKAYYQQGKYSQALDDFRQVYALDPTGETAALQGHCLCRMKSYPEAIDQFQLAIASGYQATSLFNNLGYCKMQVAEVTEADQYLHEAISLTPRCSTVWCNLVKLTIIQFDRNEVTLPDALKLINKALDVDKPSADLFFYSAILESRLTSSNPGITPRIFEHLRKAISLGVDPRRIARENSFKHLRAEKEFSSLLELSPGIQVSPLTDAIMTPF
jgi:tetratricopeptide (TPR) repeat protein